MVSTSLFDAWVWINSSEIKISLNPTDLTIWPELFSAKLKNQYPCSKLFLLNTAVVSPDEVVMLLGVNCVMSLSKGLIK